MNKACCEGLEKRLEFCWVKFPFRGLFRPIKEASG